MRRSVVRYIYILLFAVLVSAGGPAFGKNVNRYQIAIQIDTSKKAGILKQLAEAIKFRKNNLTKEQKRVQTIIEKMISRDTSLATVKDLTRLKEELYEANKQQFDTLLALIRSIRIPENTPVVIQPQESPGSNTNKPPFRITTELDPNDKYINALVDQLIPVLSDTKEQDNKVKERQERLKLVRDIYSGKNTILDTINDSTSVRYKLRLGRRAEVMGYYPYNTGYKSNPYNLSTLSTLLYYSYEIDAATGLALNFTQWSHNTVITDAQKAGTKIVMTVTSKNSLETAKFLTNLKAMQAMINNTLSLLKEHNLSGINIALTGLNTKLRPQFVEFMNAVSTAYKARSKQYQISITLPVYDEQKAYDIPLLDTLTDKFIINFSKKPTNFPGPIAPLTDDSDYNIQSCVSRYLNVGLPPYKFILSLPYYGARFVLNERTGNETFAEYVPYNQIRLNYQYAPVSYDEKQAYASIETRDDEGNLTGHIYYDNATSLEQKYDFIIQNGLGGVAFWEIGADDGYGELWDALTNKFTRIDTVSREVFSLKVHTAPSTSLWGYIKANLVIYYHALQHPCDSRYDHPDPLLLTVFNIFLALVSVAIAVVLIYQIKANGEKWRWKKLLIRILIVCVNLFIITIFMWLYIDNNIPWFGAGAQCIDMPFTVLLLVILTGIVLGTLIMRFLIFPALQHDEKP